jgi:hypothetical protein
MSASATSGVTPLRASRAVSLLTLSFAGAGCIGNLGDTSDRPGDTDPLGEGAQAQCSADGPTVGAAPLRRLTREEYANSVRDLLDIETEVTDGFVQDQFVGGFAANSVTSLSKSEVEAYLSASEDLAALALAEHGSTWFDCDLAEVSCVEPVLASLAERAFRRPVPEAVWQSLLDLYTESSAEWGADKGVELALQAILSSPYFLYHLELTAPEAGEVIVPLDDYEMASRLSYFIWYSIPDAELLAAAAQGELSTPEGIDKAARRMLEDDKAARAIETFHREWLELEVLDELVKDQTLFPEWTEELAEASRRETLAFVDDVVRGGKDAGTLFTSTTTFVDGALAEVYGVELAGEAAGELQQVELDPSERAGLLTQVSFLASRAHAADTSWVLRGKFVREKLLCETIPAPPPNVDQQSANDPDRLKNPECAACHLMMDPIGVGFENYDAVGRFASHDAEGNAIDVSGEVVDPSGQIGVDTFDGAVDLAKQLAESDRLRACMATQWFRYATRRADTKDDACSIQTSFDQFKEAGFDIRELIVATAKSDGFRHKKVQ